MMDGKAYKDYFDQDYFETPGYKSGYDHRNYNRQAYLNKAIAVWITQTLKLIGNERILEIGCAFGWVVEWMYKLYGFDVYGQEISHYAIQNAPLEIRNRIRECESVEIAFDGKFDLVYAIETFEHVPKHRVSEYFQNIYNCLNDGGIVFCTICLGHNDDRGADIDQSHQTLQPREWWNERFQEAGFVIRKDLEAEAYELGLQTPEMKKGEWLPREYNWHVFVVQKQITASTEKIKIYDRQLLAILNNKGTHKPKLLVVGNRLGNFKFPTTDFFQIDNWGNYLRYFFDAEYKTVANGGYNNINWGQYDLMLTALDHDTVSEISKSHWKECRKKICFLAGTPSMIVENLSHRQRLIEMLSQFDIVFAHAPHIKTLLDILGINSTECSEIFPFRFFDHYYSKHKHDGVNILCAGFFNSHCHLSSFSLLLASKFSDQVLMAIEAKHSIAELSDNIPQNSKLFYAMPQDRFYAEVLSQVDIILKMDNPSGVGRIIAEGAAGQIPSVAGPDLFQIRCFPELMVSGHDAIEEIIDRISEIKRDKERMVHLGVLARKRLEASNFQHFSIMLEKLNQLGFEVEMPRELYW